MGRPSPELRPRSTPGKSPVRESRTPGSAGEVPGNWRLYPTNYLWLRCLTARPALPMFGVTDMDNGLGH